MGTASTPKQSNRSQATITTIYEEDSGLTWCLQPILICLRLFGIDLSWKEQRSTFRHYLIRFGSLFWLIVNVSVTACLAVDQYNKEDDSHGDLRKYFYRIIDIKDHFRAAGIYAVFVFVTWHHGQDLAEQFQTLEINFPVGQDTYVKARRIVIVAIVFSITAVEYTNFYIDQFQNAVQLIHILHTGNCSSNH